MRLGTIFGLGVGVMLVSTSALTAQPTDLLPIGTYTLSNHPDGAENPPPYGLRIDELVDVTSGNDVFTFDFDADGSSVSLILQANRITISGRAFGGLDVGGDYDPNIRGFWNFMMIYDTEVQAVPGDDDVWVTMTGNSGSITSEGLNGLDAPVNQNLADKARGSYTFRLGNEGNDAGHRGFDGISGWGWVMADNMGQAQDWLFTATYESDAVPTPGALALGVIAAPAVLRRRRK